jgi:hypothetical protein
MRNIRPLVAFQAVALISSVVAAHAECDVRQRGPVPNCPAVTYSPEDCSGGSSGRAGTRVAHPATINVMTTGYVYYCASHGSCFELKNLRFQGCQFTFRDRDSQESPEYASHFIVE